MISTLEAIRHQAAAAGSRTRELIAAVRLIRARAAAEHEALELELRRERDGLADDARSHAADCLVIAAEALPELREVATAYDAELFGVPATKTQPAAEPAAKEWPEAPLGEPVMPTRAELDDVSATLDALEAAYDALPEPAAEVQNGKFATADESGSVADLPSSRDLSRALAGLDPEPAVTPQDYASAAEALAEEAAPAEAVAANGAKAKSKKGRKR